MSGSENFSDFCISVVTFLDEFEESDLCSNSDSTDIEAEVRIQELSSVT